MRTILIALAVLVAGCSLAQPDPVDATGAQVTLAASAEIFDHAGRDRAVLRSGTTNLAEDSVTVSE